MNPYEPTSDLDGTVPMRGSRSLLKISVTAILGISFIVFATLILFETLGIASRGRSWDPEATKGATVSAVFGLVGGSWMFSSILFWRRRNRSAAAVGLATLVSATALITLAMNGLFP